MKKFMRSLLCDWMGSVWLGMGLHWSWAISVYLKHGSSLLHKCIISNSETLWKLKCFLFARYWLWVDFDVAPRCTEEHLEGASLMQHSQQRLHLAIIEITPICLLSLMNWQRKHLWEETIHHRFYITASLAPTMHALRIKMVAPPIPKISVSWGHLRPWREHTQGYNVIDEDMIGEPLIMETHSGSTHMNGKWFLESQSLALREKKFLVSPRLDSILRANCVSCLLYINSIMAIKTWSPSEDITLFHINFPSGI